MENIKFSVIVPVYNTEKYIKKCLKSIISNTYENFEIIVVNDGSTDNSEKIIKKLAEKCDRLKLISQENAGVSIARKNGVDASDGEYILFVDSDDWINESTLKKCCSAICEHNLDMIQLNSVDVLGFFKKPCSGFTDIVIFDRNEFLNKYIYGLSCGAGVIGRGITKVYKKELVVNALKDQSVKLKIWEDGYMNLQILTDPAFQKGALFSQCLYYYRKGSGITSSTDQDMQYHECMKSKAAIYDLMVKKGIKNAFLEYCLMENIGMTRYYLKYKFKETDNNAEREKIFADTMNLPAVRQIKAYMSVHPEWINKENEFIGFDFDACCKYIEESSEENLKQSIPTKIKLLLHKIF